MKLQSSAKVKPKGRPPGAKNKKQSISQVDLEGSTRQDPFRFKYEAKGRRTGKESQGNIHVKKRKRGDQGNGSCQKKIKTQAKKNKTSADSLGLD